MGVANITGNLLNDTGLSLSSYLPLTGGTLTGALNGTSGTFSGQVEGTIINSTSNAFRLSGNNALSLVTLNSQSVVKINAAGFWGVQLVGANDSGIVINNTGNVGINTNSPVSSTGSTRALQIGGSTIMQSVVNNQSLFGDNVYYDGSGWRYVTSNNAAAMRIGALAVGDFTFHSAAYATAGSSIPNWDSSDIKMTIKASGNIGIATTSPAALLTLKGRGGADIIFQMNDESNIRRCFYIPNQYYGYMWAVGVVSNGGKAFSFGNQDGSEVGTIVINSSSVAYNTTSDYRLKEDLKDFDGLSILSKVKFYDFKWKSEDTRTTGVIAHELQEVVPYAVNGEKDAIGKDDNPSYQGVDYSKLIAIMGKAIQELNQKVTALENK